MGYSRAELESFRDSLVPDLIGPRTRLLLVGINPGLWTAAAQAHFARRGNRLYPALFGAGLVDRLIDASSGYTDDERQHLLDRGIGITNLVARATARADELDRTELISGARNLTLLVERVCPTVVAVLGITAYREAFEQPKARTGRQPDTLAGSQLWVVPNPSGLNAHSSLADLSASLREVGQAAGLVTA